MKIEKFRMSAAGFVLPLISANDLLAATEKKATSMMSSGISVFFWLLVVVGAFYALAWLTKKSGSIAGTNENLMKVVSAVSVGPKERVVALKVNNKLLIVGVTNQNVNKLAEMEYSEPEANVENDNSIALKTKKFAQMFSKAKKSY